MARKCMVKVVLSKEQKVMLCKLAAQFGLSESEIMRTTLMDYSKDFRFVMEPEPVLREKYRPIET